MKSYIKPIVLGNTKIDNNIFFAPMAGGSELSFRKICHRMGAGLVCTELVTARGIRYQQSIEKNYRYLEISPEEFPVAIQLFGADPEDFRVAINNIFEHPLLSKCAIIDINMGCPVPKVVKTGAGSALMKNLPLASSIIKMAVNSSPVPVTVKFRKGWNDLSVNAEDFGKMCESEGASLITVHGRTTSQMYLGKADWEIIRKVKQSVQIPVIGNGDVVDSKSAISMFDQTGVDGIMIGRAALGNPWIFRQILLDLTLTPHSEFEFDISYKNETTGEFTSKTLENPSLTERVEIIKEHMAGTVLQMGEKTAMKEMRKHFAWYLKGVPGCANAKRELVLCSTQNDATTILDSLI